jgi:hypothetical protein
MSVPPQQPGPYGQQPGQFGQQPGQFGQQPGPGQQPGGFPPPAPGFPPGGQQPGYGTPPGGYQQHPGQPGQPGQPGYGQQPYGQPGQFNQPGYGQPGGFGGPSGMPPKKSPMPWILGGAGALVVIVVAVVLIVTMTGGSAKSTAEAVVAEMNKGADMNLDNVRELTCKKDVEKLDELKDQLGPGTAKDVPKEYKDIKTKYTLGEVTENGDTADAKVTIAFTGVPEEMKEFLKDKTDTIKFIKEDGDWKVCGSFGGS